MRAALCLAAAVAAATASAQEPAVPESVPADLSAAAAASLPGLDAARARGLAEALRAEDYARAETLLLDAAQHEPVAPEVLRLLGAVSFRRGSYLNAAIALKKAEAKAPLDEKSRFTLAMAYVVMGRRDWARPELETLASSAPGNPLYRYWTARLDFDEQHYAEAAAGFARVLALDPAHVKAHDNLGLCYEALGRYDDALGHGREAVRLNAKLAAPSPWPPLNLGVLLVRLDRPAEAETLLRESARYDARFAPARYQLGVVLERTGRAADALAALEEATGLDPKYPEPLYLIARIHRREGRTADADRALESFRRLKAEKRTAGPGMP